MAIKLEFAPLSTPPKGVLVVFCDDGLKFGSATRQVLAETGDLVARAAAAERFKGKIASAQEMNIPGTGGWPISPFLTRALVGNTAPDCVEIGKFSPDGNRL